GLMLVAWDFNTDESGPNLTERTWSGSSTAKNKVAVIRVEGVIFEDAPGYSYYQKQMDKAAKDSAVKAVVLRVNSPGGTITGSDDLHKRLAELKNGNSPRFKSEKKPVVVSMGAMAASGGYYISMPGDYIYAERTTTTGSIGVYASFPDLHKLANEHGVKMELI